MVTDQLSMFDAPAESAKPGAPRCRMCARPARWMRTQQYGMYCAGMSCNNRERICQNCDKPFHMNVGLAGTKYCAACKMSGRPDRAAPNQPAAACAWCPKPVPRGYQHRAGIWPYICQECIDPIRHLVDRLKRHKVPHERAQQLLNDPGCEVCGTDLIARVRDANTGKLVSQLVVDHDHGCCPGPTSCGRCVRGLLCFQCNSAAGMLRDSPCNARRLADYLESRFGLAGGVGHPDVRVLSPSPLPE